VGSSKSAFDDEGLVEMRPQKRWPILATF